MRSHRCLSLSLSFVFCLSRVANAQVPAASPQDAGPSTARVPLAATESEELKPHTVKILPAGLEPNPPLPEDLVASDMTWRGEYEAGDDGAPLLGPDARPLPVLYNKKGKRMKSKIKLPKTHPIAIASGTMTVDGWTGKARLNYDIPDLKFIYLSAPNVGTVIVSQTAFPGSTEQRAAFRENTLTVTAGGHELQLASDKPLAGKKPESAWIRFDPAFTEDPRYPVMGYGSASNAPYEWPGAKQAKAVGVAAEVPPIPSSMRPKLATAVCISNCPKLPIVQPGNGSPPPPTAPVRAAQ